MLKEYQILNNRGIIDALTVQITLEPLGRNVQNFVLCLYINYKYCNYVLVHSFAKVQKSQQGYSF